jgi:hypothetical protein
MRKAIEKYEMFHGKRAKVVKQVNLKTPKQLILLGKAHAIEYVTNKINGGGDGTTATYRHVFETPCILAMDQSARNQLYIIGSKLKVTEAGIEN